MGMIADPDEEWQRVVQRIREADEEQRRLQEWNDLALSEEERQRRQDEQDRILAELRAQEESRPPRPTRTQAFGNARLPETPQCNLATPSPCSGLLGDAAEFLRNQSRWPDHICEEIAREMNLRWLSERVGHHEGLTLFAQPHGVALALPFDPV